MSDTILQIITITYEFEGQEVVGLKQATIKATLEHVKGLFSKLAGVADDRIKLRVVSNLTQPQQFGSEVWILAIYHASVLRVSITLKAPVDSTMVAAGDGSMDSVANGNGALPGRVAIKVVRDPAFTDFWMPSFTLEIDPTSSTTSLYHAILQQFSTLTQFWLSCNGVAVPARGYRRLAAQFKWSASEEIVLMIHEGHAVAADASTSA